MSPKSKSPSSSPSPSNASVNLPDDRRTASPSVEASPRRKKLDLSAIKKWLEAKQRRQAENDDDVVSIVTTGDENPQSDDPHDEEYRGRVPARSRIGTVQAQRDAVSPIRPRRSERFRPVSSDSPRVAPRESGDHAGGEQQPGEGGERPIRSPSITPPPPLPQQAQTPSRSKKKSSGRVKSTPIVRSDSDEEPGNKHPATSSSTKRKRIRRKSSSSPIPKKVRSEPLPFPLLPPFGASPSPSLSTTELPSALDIINNARASRSKEASSIRTPSPAFLPANKSDDERKFLLRFFDDEASEDEEEEEDGESVGGDDVDRRMQSQDEYDYADSFIDDGAPCVDHSDSDVSMRSRRPSSTHSRDVASDTSEDSAIIKALKALKDAKKARAAKKLIAAQKAQKADANAAKAIQDAKNAREKEERETKRRKEKEEKEAKRAEARQGTRRESEEDEERRAAQPPSSTAPSTHDSNHEHLSSNVPPKSIKPTPKSLKSALKTSSPTKLHPKPSDSASKATRTPASTSKSSKKGEVVEISSDSEDELDAQTPSKPSKPTSGTTRSNGSGKPIPQATRESASKEKSAPAKCDGQAMPSVKKGKQRAVLRTPSPAPESDGDTSDGELSAYERQLREAIKASKATGPSKVGESSSQGSASSPNAQPPTTPVTPLRPARGVSMKDFLKSVKPIATPESSAPKKAAQNSPKPQDASPASPSRPFDPNADPTIAIRCKDLPDVDEVNDPALQDPILADRYVGLPRLRRGILTPWTDTPGKGFISFSVWADWIPGMNAANAYNAVNFTQAGPIRNPARVSPLDIAEDDAQHKPEI
ncbi:hypothetical protein DFP72DRAFT_1063975 [Ephemerocybe angulata]|uniref:Uncharacterized protein n=1 Tax=Ephemerocybe angulata TaxID=980116 RepID=A0A8H6I989_9AGAR|nr:hypothetical protein DFP72DRAFT_1063975 [Tulosesus angulatus]